MKRTKLGPEEIRQGLTTLNGWAENNGQLHRTFQLKDFVDAFAFMTAVALLAESLNHHPNWSNVYNQRDVHLSTHDAGGITEFDFELARRIDGVFGKMS